jgi:hypothetical protein
MEPLENPRRWLTRTLPTEAVIGAKGVQHSLRLRKRDGHACASGIADHVTQRLVLGDDLQGRRKEADQFTQDGALAGARDPSRICNPDELMIAILATARRAGCPTGRSVPCWRLEPSAAWAARWQGSERPVRLPFAHQLSAEKRSSECWRTPLGIGPSPVGGTSPSTPGMATGSMRTGFRLCTASSLPQAILGLDRGPSA